MSWLLSMQDTQSQEKPTAAFPSSEAQSSANALVQYKYKMPGGDHYNSEGVVQDLSAATSIIMCAYPCIEL